MQRPRRAGLRVTWAQRKTEPKDQEDTYTFVKEIPADYKCLICSKLLKEPQVTECCGQHYCLHCLEQWLRGNQDKTCPMCRTQPCNYMRYLPMKREIDELEVYCTHKTIGCSVISTLKNAEEHLKICDYEELACSCRQKLLRKELTNHKQISCPNRQVTCPHCRKTGPFHQITSQGHQNQCPEFPVHCPNRCGTSAIKRKNLESHKTTCPMALLECPFSKAGCQKKVPRTDLESHQASGVQEHLLLVMNAFSQLSAQHNKLQKAHDTLQREHAQLKRTTSQRSGITEESFVAVTDTQPRRLRGFTHSRDEDYNRDEEDYYSEQEDYYSQNRHEVTRPRTGFRRSGLYKGGINSYKGYARSQEEYYSRNTFKPRAGFRRSGSYKGGIKSYGGYPRSQEEYYPRNRHEYDSYYDDDD